MKLDKRLSAVAEYVRKNSILADIGTDHAYLPTYLLLSGKIQHAIASDLRKGPLNNAAKTLDEYMLSDKVELRISDGLDSIKENEVNEITICGMGGLLISDFIKRTNWLKNKNIHLILQPMTHIEDLRKTLSSIGFKIESEKYVKDDNKYYVILSAYYEDEIITFPEHVYVIGFGNREDKIYIEYLRKLYDKYYKKYLALKNSDNEYREVEYLLMEIKKCLN